MRLSTLTLLAVGLVVIAAPAAAYHDDGVAHCNGCHTMHNSQNGVAMNFNATGTGPGLDPGLGYTDLLLFANKSDVCLRCHAGDGSYHVWSDDPLAPADFRGAGDFVFLEEDNLNDGHGGGDGVCSGGGHDNEQDCTDNNWVWTWDEPIPGEAAGHTLASGIKGTTSDTTLLTAPGGTFDSGDLGCSSCHDPHGNSSFRLLYMEDQNNGSGTIFAKTVDASEINLFFPGSETDTNHNVYRDGYSEWCSSCHGDFHAASAELIHPSGELLDADQVVSYNLYLGSTDCANNPPGTVGTECGSGVKATAYKAAVPIQQGVAFAGDVDSTEGATDGTSGVACVTCHRAHATSGPDAGRWDFNVTGLEEDGHESGSWKIPNAYAGDTSQRSLCNKCHSQDEYDAIIDFTP